MQSNINTKDYWDNRFSSNEKDSWIYFSGESQTNNIALSISKNIKCHRSYPGTILDFGCALGDAIPVYKKRFHSAKFIGIDFSSTAIEICKKKYGDIAHFIQADVDEIPNVDIIIASNVLEHISSDKDCILKLLNKCKELYIAVPYKEKFPLHEEHLRSYDKYSIDYLKKNKNIKVKHKLFFCIDNRIKIKNFFYFNLLNIIRPFFGKTKKTYNSLMYQILYHIIQKESSCHGN